MAWYGYLYINTGITKRLVTAEHKKIQTLQQEMSAFSDIPGFDKLQLVKNLENNNYQMPWSDHIQAVMEIFDAILGVDGAESQNIILSDFKISLEEISLNGYVSNLRILYNSPDPDKKTALIDRFEQLDFLEEISIKTYRKAQDNLGYEFVLTAKVVNHDTK
ncbi:MAG: hypothetical protein LBH96_04220 [Candidatus Peribacteria bacterium]|nr:hypothetical protein [Candidatus Peribacteria bacterium]